MKVILIKDVARLGRKGEVKDVPDGHAQNFLIPRKCAVVATQEGLRRVAEEAKKHDEHHEKARDTFKRACDILGSKVVSYPTPANEQGHLFKGIGVRDILKHLESEEHIVLDEAVVELAHPIKAVGTHTVPLAFDGFMGTCKLEVIKK